MKKQCFDESTIQAFFDGELASGMLENVARHVALCDECAMLLAETEEESAFAFAALDDELNSLVPTERIRTNVYQAISEIEKPKVSFWEKITSLGFILSNPSIAAFAGLLIVAGLVAVVWEFNDRNAVSTTETARVSTVNNSPSNIANIAPTRETSNESNVEPVQPQIVSQTSTANRPKVAKADYRPKSQTAKNHETAKTQVEPVTSTVPAENLSGEDTYLKTIATLKKTVDGSKDMILDTSARVAYEKDMAMVDDAIVKMKTEVRKNPKNEVAKEVLRNSYQNKIDLLSSVAEQNQMVAGLN